MSLFDTKTNRRGRRSKGAAPSSAKQAARLSAQRLSSEAEPAKDSPSRLFWRRVIATALALITLFIANILVFSHLYHTVEQTRLRSLFRDELAQSIAPTSEVTFDKVILKQGDPVAIIKIPAIGVNEVVVEGTDSATLRSAPGHRRDTVLPGQQGLSIIMGRASAYGGPFSRLQSLPIGSKITVITGQGVQKYKSLGIRYAGDLTLPPVAAGQSRLVLMTARGEPYNPHGIAQLDAQLISPVQPVGVRTTTTADVPREDREFGFDLRYAWALLLTIEFLIAAEVAAVWCYKRFGPRGTYLVFAPTLLYAAILVMDQTTRLLPNLL
jgi:LPXTG-site transpeptidase (sortase) family protein